LLEPLDMSSLDRPTEPPDYILDGLLERGGVTILSGDTGTSKSLVALSICAAVIRGDSWMGRATRPGPVVVSDAEMTQRLAYERLRGFGFRGSDADSLGYLSRQAIDLGDEESVEALRDLCSQRKASVLALDALMGHAPGVDVNDNSAAVRLYAEVLRPLAADLNLALLLVHHDSKPRQGPRDSSLATMGARQWVGQADVQLTLEKAPKPHSTVTTDSAGFRSTTYRVRLRTPKRRDAPDAQRFEPLRVASRHNPDSSLDWIRVETDDAGPASEPAQGRDRDQENAEALIAFARDRDDGTTTAELAEAVGIDARSDSFKRPLNLALSMGLERVSRGVYRHDGLRATG